MPQKRPRGRLTTRRHPTPHALTTPDAYLPAAVKRHNFKMLHGPQVQAIQVGNVEAVVHGERAVGVFSLPCRRST